MSGEGIESVAISVKYQNRGLPLYFTSVLEIVLIAEIRAASFDPEKTSASADLDQAVSTAVNPRAHLVPLVGAATS